MINRKKIKEELLRMRDDNGGIYITDELIDYIVAERMRIVCTLIKAIKRADKEDCVYGQCDIYEEAIDTCLFFTGYEK